MEVFQMEKAKEPKDSLEDKKPAVSEEDKTKQDTMYEERLDALEQKVDKILESLSSSHNAEMSKEDDEDDDEDNGREDKKPKDEDKTKEKNPPEGEPKEGKGTVKLPKAPAGETDEDASIESDKIHTLEKKIAPIVEKTIENVLKNKGWVKSDSTPRPTHDIAKRNAEKKQDFAAEIRKKVAKGEMTVAQMNREVKSFVTKQNDERVKEFFDAHRNEEVA